MGSFTIFQKVNEDNSVVRLLGRLDAKPEGMLYMDSSLEMCPFRAINFQLTGLVLGMKNRDFVDE